jgi:two-component system C4-dicarboxylate transport sensor histidine kinase DctB
MGNRAAFRTNKDALPAGFVYRNGVRKRFWNSRTLLLLAGLTLVVLSSVAGSLIWQARAERALVQAGEQRLSLVAASVRSAILQNDHLPLALALDPDVRQALRQPGDAAAFDLLNRKLSLLVRASSAAALYVMDLDGDTIAASNWNEEGSFLGQNYAFRSYFQLALETGRGAFYAIGATTSRAGYFLSQAVEEEGRTIGVAVVKIEFDEVEKVWADADESVLVTDANDIVFLASTPRWKYRTLSPLSEDVQDEIARTQQYAGETLAPMAIDVAGGSDAAAHIRLDGRERVFVSQSAPLDELGWTVLHLTDTVPLALARRDGAIIGGSGSALLLALAFAFIQRQRMLAEERRARLLLEERVESRTAELTAANRRLVSEVEERERAEGDLRAAQAELVQAEKLAALGRMSAAIAHEVNQPLGAIRTSAASAVLLMLHGKTEEATETLSRIGTLASRAAAITAHLRNFARKGRSGVREPFAVDLALQRALDLSRESLEAAGVALVTHIEPIMALGNALPFEQVAANLIGNAIDAVSGKPDGRIEITARERGGRIEVRVSDNGPGFPQSDIDKVFDPFFTTKGVGEGLGLGLSIAYGIVQEFSGSIRAVNLPGGGACVTVELDMARDCVQKVSA